jgi:hypothetical protein
VQGDVYAKIIEDVCTASRNDFDEHGITTATLDELRAVRILSFGIPSLLALLGLRPRAASAHLHHARNMSDEQRKNQHQPAYGSLRCSQSDRWRRYRWLSSGAGKQRAGLRIARSLGARFFWGPRFIPPRPPQAPRLSAFGPVTSRVVTHV